MHLDPREGSSPGWAETPDGSGQGLEPGPVRRTRPNPNFQKARIRVPKVHKIDDTQSDLQALYALAYIRTIYAFAYKLLLPLLLKIPIIIVAAIPPH